jgi:hypothetical protein
VLPFFMKNGNCSPVEIRPFPASFHHWPVAREMVWRLGRFVQAIHGDPSGAPRLPLWRFLRWARPPTISGAHFLWISGSTQAGYALFDLPNLHSSPSTHPKT